MAPEPVAGTMNSTWNNRVIPLREFRIQSVFFAVIFLFGVACSDEAGSGNDAADAGGDSAAEKDGSGSERFRFLVESMEQEMDALDIPGAAVAVMENGQVTFAQGFGTRHPDREEPVKPTTLFRIGSVTKMITAAGLLQLVDEGRVDLDAPITDYIPDFGFSRDESWAPGITARHLLTHSSGIYDYLEVDTGPELRDDDALSVYMNGEFGDVSYLMAPSGRMYNYSNPNFMLSGLITETVSGEYYNDYIRERVLMPLGMKRTFFLPEEVLEDGDYACGLNNMIYWGPELPLVVAPDSYDNGWARPAGYAFSSVLDLARFVSFLRDGNTDVLSDELRKAMQEPQFCTEEILDITHYGYGLFISQGAFYGPGPDDFYDLKLVTHGGAIPGFSAGIYYMPELDFAFIVLAGADGAYFENSFVTAVNTLCEMPDAAQPPDLTMDTDSYDIYAGEYFDDFMAGEIIISRDGDDLLVDIPGFDSFGVAYERVLESAAPDNFILYLGDTPLTATFLFDDEDNVEYLRTRIFVATPVQEDAGVSDKGRAVPVFNPDSLIQTLPYLPPYFYPDSL